MTNLFDISVRVEQFMKIAQSLARIIAASNILSIIRQFTDLFGVKTIICEELWFLVIANLPVW